MKCFNFTRVRSDWKYSIAAKSGPEVSHIHSSAFKRVYVAWCGWLIFLPETSEKEVMSQAYRQFHGKSWDDFCSFMPPTQKYEPGYDPLRPHGWKVFKSGVFYWWTGHFTRIRHATSSWLKRLEIWCFRLVSSAFHQDKPATPYWLKGLYIWFICLVSISGLFVW